MPEQTTNIQKSTGSSLYERQVGFADALRETQWQQILALLTAAVSDIADPTALDGRFNAMSLIDEDLQDQITGILNGTIQFTQIYLPDMFAFGEIQVAFGDGGHAHAGGASGQQVSHPSLLDMTADDHHTQVHGLGGSDHTGPLAEAQVTWDITGGHAHDGTAGKQISHPNIVDIGEDDHHPKEHDLDSHTGTLDDASVAVAQAGLVATSLHDAITEMLGMTTTHAEASATAAHGLSLLELAALGAAEASVLSGHMGDPVGHADVAQHTLDIGTLQTDMFSLQGTVAGIGSDVADLLAWQTGIDLVLPTKLNIADLIPTLLAWGGGGAVLGGVTALEAGTFDTLMAGILEATSLAAASAAIESLDVTTMLTVSGGLAFPAASIDPAWVGPLVVGSTWNAAPTDLNESLNNIRAVMATVSGEPWNLNGANPPALSPTSSFAGETLRTFEELEWYRNWFVGSMWTRGMIVDVFEDASGTDLLGGGATIADHALRGAGTCLSKEYVYTATMYTVEYVNVHVEAEDPSAVTVTVIADGMNNPAINDTQFDNDFLLDFTGQSIQLLIEVSNNTAVYSYGVLLGRLS